MYSAVAFIRLPELWKIQTNEDNSQILISRQKKKTYEGISCREPYIHLNRAKLIYSGPVYMSYYIKKYCSDTAVNHD